ncbi:unnamed protein product [Kuraishia capsulata CBS 1993]|uniref:Amino acid permease/ SLC12A domain-containing protein n=1 Tax=Kuraishia capsulata CBS 1993 TaxID=1382522 RepID=W6MLV7_9ASCO|nr:uncharacterized protein KUCA_T00003115001 [Kuraishia capsulata CBS 1993]CDK27138.1 unnamed protein product [Kuraishia capsulata CBS 1993]
MKGVLKNELSHRNENSSKLNAGLEITEFQDSEMGEGSDIQDGDYDNALEQNFDIWGVVGIVNGSIATPLTLGTYLSTVIGVGGAPFFFYAYLFAGFFCLTTAFCISEMASVHPHSSALVYWSQMFSPPKYARPLAYFSGILSCACYIFGTAATSFFVADLVLGLVDMRHPDYVSKTFHYYLIFLVSVILSALFNIYAARLLPLLGRLTNYVFNGTAIFTLIALLARAHPKQTAAFAFKDVTNETGWSSNGVVFFLSILPTTAAVALFDGACHMTDEIPNPKKHIPMVITYGYSGAYLTGVVAILVYNFCIVNSDNLLAPVGGIPLFQLYVDSMDNAALSTVSALFIVVCYLMGTISIMTSASRLVMAFAEFKGLPCGDAIGSVNKKLNAPVWAIIFVTIWSILIGLLIFASTTALNAVSGSYISTMYVSYLIPFVGLVFKKDRFGEGVKPLFNLGRWGKPMNIICIFWFLFASAWLCVPTYVPVTADTMNYTIVVLFITAIVAAVNWFAYAGKHFSFKEVIQFEEEERIEEAEIIQKHED